MTGAQTGPSQVVILGAGRAVRGGVPSAIVDIDDHGRVMDWLLDAFAALEGPDVCFVGGFKADEVMERYPGLRLVLNRDWARTGPVRSLGLVALDADRPTYVCYSDVVFRRRAVEALADVGADADVAIAVDTTWRARYDGRTRTDLDHAEKVRIDGRAVVAAGRGVDTRRASAEFAGVLRMSGRAAGLASSAIRSGKFTPNAALPDLIGFLVDAGLAVVPVDLAGEWAELDAKQDLARFVLGTKAESLDRLRNMSHGGEIGALVAFTFGEWTEDRPAMLARIVTELAGDRLIVRSSARNEDGWDESGAGRHESVLDVVRAPDEIAAAVDRVFASYGSEEAGHQVLVQEMLHDVVMSGVVMTRTHALGAPYYVLNFDDSTARTDTVTAGGDARTVFVHRDATLRDGLPSALGAVLQTVQNVEKLVGHDSLDVEFAVTADTRVHILQVRPIAVTHTPTPIDDEQISTGLVRAGRFLRDRLPPPPTLVGGSTQYSVMSDWNPAEIIGTTPKRLAFSLYRHLVTDEVWARQRAEYGYRDVRPCPLLVDIVGHPYVDVRATFNSFVPAVLDDHLAARLVDHYLERLARQPTLHDKIEFAIVHSCLTADFDARSTTLRGASFTGKDVARLRDALRDITVSAFARLDTDLAQLPRIAATVRRVSACALPPLEQAYHHLETARTVGTPLFAHLARGAFVATSLLRSLETAGAITAEELAGFLASVDTVLGQMQSDGTRVKRGELSWDDFVDRYGHLRPGTYDITSLRYGAAADEYLRPVVDAAPDEPAARGAEPWASSTRAAVSRALAHVGLPEDVDAFMKFARGAIAGREEAKFVFTQALSEALECIATFGATSGIERDDLAHVGIGDIMRARDLLPDPAAFFAQRVLEGREAHHVAQGVCLPGHIASEADLFCFEQQVAEANFVSQKAVEARVLSEDLGPGADVSGTIVLIPNADPGFDWLLARDIVGLVTMYGGANSHMAVRAAELRLAAAIGVGELRYRELEGARVIRLDCASRTITRVQ